MALVLSCVTFLLASTFFVPTLFAPTTAPEAPKKADDELTFNLTDADIKGLNLSENEAAELRQFFDALNNLSPDEKQQLKDLGEETEKKMRDKKLDPTNFDDLVKFMEEEEKEAKGIQPSLPTTPSLEEKAPAVEKKPVIPISSPKDTVTLLREIERKLESVLVKIKSREALEKKLSTLSQEVSEFRYFIKVLQAPDLVLLLASKEFERLHKNLEALHKALATSEPSILARQKTGDMDDPYEVLGISYDATPEQITQTYTKLKETQSPEAVEKALKDVAEKDRKKTIKKARLTWSFIQNAYETLIDENQRALARKELKNKIEEEARHDRASRVAFDKIFNALTTAFYPNALLKDIKSLLEKHKPQELELAKKTLESEKKAAERAKQPVRIETTPIRGGMQEEPYAAFWQKMAQESYMRPMYPTPPPSVSPPAGPSESPGAKSAQKGKEKGTEKKKGKGKEGKKDEKKGKEKAEKGKEKVSLKDVPKFAALAELEKLLKEAKTTLEVADEPKRRKPTPPTPSDENKEEEKADEAADESKEEQQEPDKKPKTRQIKYETIGINLAKDLRIAVTRAAPGPDESAKQTRRYYEENKLADITKALKKLAPGKEKPDSQLCKEWGEKIMKPYGKLLKGWHSTFYSPLSHLQLGKRHPTKSILYNLNTPEPTDKDFFKKDEDTKDGKKPEDKKMQKPDKKEPTATQPAGPAINLAEVRDTLKAMNAYVENINKGCGAAAPKPGAKKQPAKKDEEEEDKENEKPEESDDSDDKD